MAAAGAAAGAGAGAAVPNRLLIQPKKPLSAGAGAGAATGALATTGAATGSGLGTATGAGASGSTPFVGLVTAIIGGFIISATSGSRVQIGGPTGAFIVVVYGVIQSHGMDGLIVATIMAGINQSLMMAFGMVVIAGIGTVSLSTLLASPVRTWLSGPEMVEAHYRGAPGGEPPGEPPGGAPGGPEGGAPGGPFITIPFSSRS